MVVKQEFSYNHSGLVIAGFGEDQVLPSIRYFEIDGKFL